MIGGYRTQGLIYLLGEQGKHVSLVVRQLPMKAGWWDAPLMLWELAVAISMTTSKISYSLIKAQVLPWNTYLQLQIPYTCNQPTPHIYRVQANLENLEKTVFFATLRENLENSGNFEKIFQIPGKLREFCWDWFFN